MNAGLAGVYICHPVMKPLDMYDSWTQGNAMPCKLRVFLVPHRPSMPHMQPWNHFTEQALEFACGRLNLSGTVISFFHKGLPIPSPNLWATDYATT